MSDEKQERPAPSNEDVGVQFLHCGVCLHEKPADQTPREYARLQVSWTKVGLQVWCVRHECNVLHVDFEGQKHPANTTRKRAADELLEKRRGKKREAWEGPKR